MGAAAPRWLQPPVRQCSLQSPGQAAAQPLSALVGCPWLSQPSISRPSCSRPICNSRGTALAPAALLRFAAAQRVLPLPRHAHVRRARGQRLRAPPSGYRLSALHNPRDGGGNRSRQFQPQPGRSAVAVCDRQAPDAPPASAGQLKTEAAACSGAAVAATAKGCVQEMHRKPRSSTNAPSLQNGHCIPSSSKVDLMVAAPHSGQQVMGARESTWNPSPHWRQRWGESLPMQRARPSYLGL